MKNYYRYYQRGEALPWIPVSAEDAEVEARREQSIRLTILATDKLLGGLDGGATPPPDLKFYGPMYFDIDHKNDLKLAIESANRLVNGEDGLVKKYGVEERDIDIFLSGTKGVHILLDPSLMGITKGIARLPAIYREMARELYVSGVDLQPYGVRNGFRLTNTKREDGNYRVQITSLELATLTEEAYRRLCSQPRHNFVPPRKSGKQYVQMAALFQACADGLKKQDKETPQNFVVESAELKEKFAVEPPPCMLQLAEGKKAETASYNAVVMQVAIFAARLNSEGFGEFRKIAEQITDNQKSSEYNTARKRMEHLEGQYNYMRHTNKYSFSCAAVRGVLKTTKCCEECPLQSTKLIDSPIEAARSVNLLVRGDGYYDASSKVPRRISTFTIEPKHIFNEIQQNGQVVRIGTAVEVKVGGQLIGEANIPEAGWANRASFLRCFSGLGNTSFLGNETDIQKIHYMVKSEKDLPEKIATREMGMHISTVQEKEIRTYVERNSAVNNMRMLNTHVFEGFDNHKPFLLSSDLKSISYEDHEARQGLIELLRMNSPEIMGGMVGWAAACQLKAHIMHCYKQFPLINLWGNFGSGKSTVARYALALAGTDYVTEHTEINIPMTTEYAWLISLTNSSTNPVFWDEVNRTGERMNLKKYARAVEMLKAGWNGQAAQKGKISGTNGGRATLDTYLAVRPVLYCSEQQADSPALLERTLTLFVNKNDIAKYRGQDRVVRKYLNGLKRLSYTLMLTALATPTSEVAAKLDEHLRAMPEEMAERPKYCLAVAMFGLHWLQDVMKERGLLNEELQSILHMAMAAVAERASSDNLAASNKQISSEVDKVFSSIFDILDLAVQQAHKVPGITSPLVLNTHFIVLKPDGMDRTYLYVDVRACHAAYLQWARQRGINVILDDVRTFAELAKQENYVVSIAKDEKVLMGRHVFHIDLDLAEARGLPVFSARLAANFVQTTAQAEWDAKNF